MVITSCTVVCLIRSEALAQLVNQDIDIFISDDPLTGTRLSFVMHIAVGACAAVDIQNGDDLIVLPLATQAIVPVTLTSR